MEGLDRLTPSKVNLQYVDDTVVFTICDCSSDKNYSLYKLTREQFERLISRLKHFEEMTWRQLSGADREHGLTTENPDSESYRMIDDQNSSDQFMEKYYFHIRIEQRGLFRVFGYQRDRFFCITHVDSGGRIHHS